MPRVICDNVARRCASCLCGISHYVFFDIDIFIQLLMLLWLVSHMGDWISPYYTLFLMMLLNFVLSRSRCSFSHRRFRVCRRIGRRRFAQSRIKHGHRFRKVLCMHKFALVYFLPFIVSERLVGASCTMQSTFLHDPFSDEFITCFAYLHGDVLASFTTLPKPNDAFPQWQWDASGQSKRYRKREV